MNKEDVNKIAKIISHIAKYEIIPLFRNIKTGDISEKSGGDFVTAADKNSQSALIRSFGAIVPDSRFISEELIQVQSDIENIIRQKDKFIWVIDPLDGTRNFIKGCPCFAVAVCLVKNREPLAAWIHKPLSGETACALKNTGAWIAETGEELKIDRKRKLSSHNILRGDSNNRLRDVMGKSFNISQLHSCSSTYMELVKGNMDLAAFSNNLNVWDHLPGTFIHTEAGGYNALGSGNIYRVDNKEKMLIIAPNQEIWQKVHSVVIQNQRTFIKLFDNSRE